MSEIWLAGETGDSQAVLYHSADSGASWTREVVESAPGLQAIRGVDADDIYALGTVSGTVVGLHYDGDAWSAEDAGIAAGDGAEHRIAVSGGAILVAGGVPFLFTTGRLLQRSSGTWSSLGTVSDESLIDIWAIASNDVYLLSETQFVTSEVMHWDGASLVDFSPALDPGMYFGIVGLSSNALWVGGNGGIWYFNGASWTQQHVDALATIRRLAAVDASHVWAGGDGEILFWDGDGWEDSGATISGQTRDVYACSATEVYAVTTTEVVVWDGDSWNDITPSVLDPGDTLYGVYAIAGAVPPVDTDPPYLANLDPARGQLDVLPGAAINLDVLDAGDGVASTSVQISLDGVVAWNAGAAHAGFSGSATSQPLGYRYAIDPLALLSPGPHLVQVEADDLATPANHLSDSYRFNVPRYEEHMHSDGWYWVVGDDRDYEITDSGQLTREKTIATRCRMRLLTRRGEWFADKDFGSRLHMIKTLKNARRLAEDYVREALQPLIDDGSILSIAIKDLVEDYSTGALAVWVESTLPGDAVLPLGLIPLGGTA